MAGLTTLFNQSPVKQPIESTPVFTPEITRSNGIFSRTLAVILHARTTVRPNQAWQIVLNAGFVAITTFKPLLKRLQVWSRAVRFRDDPPQGWARKWRKP